MACHTEQAEKYGVDVLWWSDHDHMMQMIHRTAAIDIDDLTLSWNLEGDTLRDHQGEQHARLLAESWLAAEAYGCDAVEVGYRVRGGVGLEHHLMFWDLLSEAGVYVTGIGTSDHHHASDWLDIPNPFLTWIFVDEPSRNAVAEQVVRGRVFFGDPGPFVGHQPLLDLWSESGAVMGQVLACDLDQVVHVETGHVEAGWSLELMVDGRVSERAFLEGDERDTVFVVPREDVRTIRAQLVDEDGMILLLTNPLYLIEATRQMDVPSLRLVAPDSR